MPTDPFEFDEEFGPLTPRPRMGGGGIFGNPHVVMAGGGGGGYRPPMPPVSVRHYDLNLSTNQLTRTTDMDSFTNHEARALAAETLSEKKTEGIRSKVVAAVQELSSMFADVNDGTVFSFVKTVDERDYHYAAIKSNGKWFSTGAKTALTAGDTDDLITWLIGLEIYGNDDFVAFAEAKAPAVLEATVSDG